MVLGYENHAEKSVGEILAKVGDKDADLIGVAADTGWFGTQGGDAPRALRELSGRLRYVHLKDVKARRSEPSGYALIDMGHETCALGSGIVNVRGCVDALLDVGYTGALSVEHEPEHLDPRPDVVASKALLERWLSGAR